MRRENCVINSGLDLAGKALHPNNKETYFKQKADSLVISVLTCRSSKVHLRLALSNEDIFIKTTI